MRFDREMFTRYLWFVSERHRVWEKRQQGRPGPWTEDPILASRKFTNVFRVLDPGSQFIFNLEHEDPSTTLMRLFLYRHTGRVEAWEWMDLVTGGYPVLEGLDDVLAAWTEYRGEPKISMTRPWRQSAATYTGPLKESRSYPRTVFTSAYLVYPQSSSPGTDKLESIIRLTQRLFGEEKLAEGFLQARTQSERFGSLHKHRGVADFMSMQILTDWGYTQFGGNHENEFVVPGPGCRKGVATITDARDVAGFLAWVREEVLSEADCPVLDFGGHRRYPSLMDIQNTMCEFSKYVRYLNSGATAKPYSPAHPGAQPTPILPAHWA